MLVFAVVSQEEIERWKDGHHPFSRGDVRIVTFEGGYDLKERLLKSGLPDMLILEDAILPYSPDSFIWDLREIKSWEKVQSVIIHSRSEIPTTKQPNTHHFKTPVLPSYYEEAIKSIGKIVSRRYPRKEVNLPCSILLLGKRYDCKIKDVSLCGCRIEFEGVLKIGTIIPIAFGISIGNKGYVLKVSGKVVREMKDGYGLSFITMDGNDRNLLQAFIRG